MRCDDPGYEVKALSSAAPSSVSDQARSTERTMSRNTGCTLERSLAVPVEHGRPSRRIRTYSDVKAAGMGRKLTTDRVSRSATRTTERRTRVCVPRRFGPTTGSTLKPSLQRLTASTTAERLSFHEFAPLRSEVESRAAKSSAERPCIFFGSEQSSYASGAFIQSGQSQLAADEDDRKDAGNQPGPLATSLPVTPAILRGKAASKKGGLHCIRPAPEWVRLLII